VRVTQIEDRHSYDFLGIALAAMALLLRGGPRGSARIGVLAVAGAMGILIFTLGVAVYLLE
jgi:hypothetical protein